ncbi:MAG TPA: hypothetical protein DCZ61_07315 [Lachnospiraceae bacterium]|nr:hypothetical protein [Lachnospiraceae bacterium]
MTEYSNDVHIQIIFSCYYAADVGGNNSNFNLRKRMEDNDGIFRKNIEDYFFLCYDEPDICICVWHTIKAVQIAEQETK